MHLDVPGQSLVSILGGQKYRYIYIEKQPPLGAKKKEAQENGIEVLRL